MEYIEFIKSLKKQLKRDEGISYTPYLCTKKKWTIGVGRNLEDNQLNDLEFKNLILNNEKRSILSNLSVIEIFSKVPLNEYEVEYLFTNDVEKFIKELKRSLLRKGYDFFDNLEYERQAVLINMAFNMGVPKLMKFKITLRYLQDKEYYNASQEMLDSNWYRKDVPNRAMRLSEQMKYCEFQ